MTARLVSLRGSGAAGVLRSVLSPRVWMHMLRLAHYWNYSHVEPRRHVTTGQGTWISPNVTLRNGERIAIGANTKVGVGAALWAGPATGRISIGDDCIISPDVWISAANYQAAPGRPIVEQEPEEHDVVIGSDVWLGRGVIVVPGVSVGDGCVIGAGAVVTKTIPPNSIAVGIPAKVVGTR